MKQFLFLAACAIAGTAAAQQIHILGGENPTMLKADNIKSITYKGDAEGYTHMVVTDKADAKSEIALADNSAVVVMHEGVSDPTITPVEATSDEYKLLTDRQWSFAGAEGAGEGYTYAVDWIGEYPYDDKVTFSADGKVVYDLGATNEVYCEFTGPKTFTATGDEAFALGRKDGVRYLQFLNGAFPTYRANVKGRGAACSMTEPYEVVKLTETALQLKVEATGGEWVLINYEREPLHVLTPQEMLAKKWKAINAGPSFEEMWGPIGGSAEEVMTLNADGSMTITGNGTAESCNDGNFDYTSFTNMTWSYVERDGNKYLEFGNNGFPCAIGEMSQLGGSWEIVELKTDSLKLKMACTTPDVISWLPNYCIILVPAE